jgi:hypothetical protein
MSDPIDHQARVLLTAGDQAIAGSELEVRSVTTEWFVRGGKMVPRVTLVLEPAEP